MRLSLRKTMVFATVALLGLTVGIIFASTFLSTRAVLVGEVQAIVERDARRAAAATLDFIHPAEQAAIIAADLVAGDAGAIEPVRLERHFLTVLHEVGQIDGMFYGDNYGNFFYVNRDNTFGGTRTKQIDVSGPERVVTFNWRNGSGEIVFTESDPHDKYDPRTRPWFSNVTSSSHHNWTDPYVFFSSGQPGITTSSPVLVDGVLVGVIGVDIELAGVSDFLRTLDTSANSSAAIIGPGLTVVAHEDSQAVVTEHNDQLRYRSVGELNDPQIERAFETLRQTNPTYTLGTPTRFGFDLGGEPHQAAFAPLPAGSLPWLVAVSAPESDYLDKVRTAERGNAALVAVVGLIALLAGVWLARTFTKPLRQLRDHAQAVHEGLPREPIRSRFTEIAQTTDALFAAHNELEARVAERTADLQQEIIERRNAERKALEASNAKSDFLAHMSHELRTPLTAIIGYAGILKSKEGEWSRTEMAEHVAVIEDASNHLLELINELLELAKIEAGQLDLTENSFDVSEVAREVMQLVEPRARRRGVAVALESTQDMPMYADRRRIKQVLLNLITNAVKFTDAGGHVRVGIDRISEHITLTVADTGIGMSDDELAKAFEMFGQVGEADGDATPGTGIGLPLTRELVAKHGGRLEVKSEKGVGSTFTVTFPPERTVVPISV